MKIYIAGPMTGIEQFNFPAFDAAAEHLTKLGFDVVNPAQLDRDADGRDTSNMTGDEPIEGDDLMKIIVRDLNAVLECDGICLLDGWYDSTGAYAEHSVAEWAGKIEIEQKIHDKGEAYESIEYVFNAE